MQKYISFLGYFEFYTKFSNLVQWTVLHYNLFKYFFKTSTKIRGGQGAYYFALCKNLFMFFEKFEWINLISILVQFEDLYSNHHFSCSYIHDYSSYL